MREAKRGLPPHLLRGKGVGEGCRPELNRVAGMWRGFSSCNFDPSLSHSFLAQNVNRLT
jgi:hypothetical protein